MMELNYIRNDDAEPAWRSMADVAQDAADLYAVMWWLWAVDVAMNVGAMVMVAYWIRRFLRALVADWD